MKKRWIITLAFPTILLAACSNDFQSSNWGDSIEKVKRSENAPEWSYSESPDSTQTAIYYESQIEDLPVILFFAFTNNKLDWGKQLFTEEHQASNQYHSDYLTINSLLKAKSGLEKVDYMFSTDKYKEHPEKWGEAILKGDLLIQTKWENSRSEILHVILGENGEVLHAVEYKRVPKTK